MQCNSEIGKIGCALYDYPEPEVLEPSSGLLRRRTLMAVAETNNRLTLSSRKPISLGPRFLVSDMSSQ